MLKLKDWPAFLLGGAIGAVVFSLLEVAIHRAYVPAEPPPVLAPPCDTSANGVAAVEQLGARIEAGVANTECDLRQLGHVAYLAGGMFMERAERYECEEDLATCERGQWDAADCRRYQEASRIEDAIDALYDCAEASGR